MDNVQPNKGKRHGLLLKLLYVVIALLLIGYVALAYLNIISGSPEGYAVVTLIFGFVIVTVLAKIVFYYMSNNVHRAEAKTLSDITRIIGYSLVLVICMYIVFGYQYIGEIFVSAGFLGIILGLAAQSTISNFIAGLYLLASNALEPDDHVTISTAQNSYQPQSYPHDKFVPGISGTIIRIGALYTELVNEDGIPVYIPNNVVVQSLVINYHRAREYVRKIQFDVDIATPYERLEKVIGESLKKKGVDAFDVNLEYLHNTLYVVTVRIRAREKEIKELKSAIFSDIIKDIGESKKGPKPKYKNLA